MKTKFPTDEEIDKTVEVYSHSLSNSEWSKIGGIPDGFKNGMKFMRDLMYIRLGEKEQ